MKNIIGLRFIDNNFKTWRFTWGELSFGKNGLALDYSAGNEDDRKAHVHIKIPLINAFIYAPWRHVINTGDMLTLRSWGFYFFDRTLVLKWGKWSKSIFMPWDWKHVRHDVLMSDGVWNRDPKESWNLAGKWQENHEYHYCLKSWTVQKRIATIGIDEREWRWRWFTWLPFPRRISRTIDVTFDDEVGERSGSWKGGTLGCGYELKKNETPLECLRRMERERKF